VRVYALRAPVARWRCAHGLHWPIVWSESAYPGSWDPPEPPEPGWCCDWCCKTFDYGNYRHQLRAKLTPLWWIEWRIRREERAA
jgi:hypothetical protein